MIYRGTFLNTLNEVITVAIDVPDGDPNTTSIGAPGDDIKFMKNPVTIDQELDDLFQTIEIKDCKINLLVRNYLGGTMFARNSRDIRVTVAKNTEVLFAGWVEPTVFNQPYSREWNQLSLSCSDGLSTLQYIKYMDIQTKSVYNDQKAKIDSVTIANIIDVALK